MRVKLKCCGFKEGMEDEAWQSWNKEHFQDMWRKALFGERNRVIESLNF